MTIGSLLKTGYQYAKTGLKYASALPKYAVGEGGNVISAARKSVGGGYTIFQNPVAKTKAGYAAFKADLKATVAKPGLFAKAKTLFKNGVSTASAGKELTKLQKLVAGTKGITGAMTSSVKSAWRAGAFGQMKSVLAKGGKVTAATKIWGGTKGILKPLSKMPLLGTVIALAFEAPDIYDAFSRGGFTEGLKQVGKSTVKIGVGMAGSVVGTIIGGPVGGALGYMAGDILAGKLFKSFSEENPTETKEEDQLAEAQNNGAMPEDTDTQALRDQLREQEAKAEQGNESEKADEAEETDEQSQTAQSELPETLQASDTSAQGQQLTVNPFTQQGYTSYNNPFGFDAGSNIFQRFPMGYSFQYQGNGMGMIV